VVRQYVAQYVVCFIVAIVQGDMPDDIYAKVKEVIRVQSAPVVWVPSNEKL